MNADERRYNNNVKQKSNQLFVRFLSAVRYGSEYHPYACRIYVVLFRTSIGL